MPRFTTRNLARQFGLWLGGLLIAVTAVGCSDAGDAGNGQVTNDFFGSGDGGFQFDGVEGQAENAGNQGGQFEDRMSRGMAEMGGTYTPPSVVY